MPHGSARARQQVLRFCTRAQSRYKNLNGVTVFTGRFQGFSPIAQEMPRRRLRDIRYWQRHLFTMRIQRQRETGELESPSCARDTAF